MHTPTFRESYDLVIDAYFKDQINPYDNDFCICGTLAGTAKWNNFGRERVGPYSYGEYKRIEMGLLHGINIHLCHIGAPMMKTHDKEFQATSVFEDALFYGMTKSLDVLKEIHESRGEVIESFEFKKRELATV
jgi:hypothetical protein